MGRNEAIARCIVRAIIYAAKEHPRKRSLLRRIWSAIVAFFALYKIPLSKHRSDLFSTLRREVWQIEDSKYVESFSSESLTSLQTFFSTKDEAYLIKSIPRQFEHSFFRDDLLDPYNRHMHEHQGSLLVRICDLLVTQRSALGVPLGLAPSHHIVMENLMYGQEQARGQGTPGWESWDLKPTSYFFPERDIAAGKLSSEATKSRLADKFEDKLILTQDQSDLLIQTLERDTELLRQCNAVDYSLFLVRITTNDSDPFSDSSVVATDAPFAPPSPPSWRTGIVSPDGEHVFRATILDFFWAKHKTQPKVMTGLIQAYNTIDRQGPMSITTTATEYRQRFLDMCKSFIQISA